MFDGPDEYPHNRMKCNHCPSQFPNTFRHGIQRSILHSNTSRIVVARISGGRSFASIRRKTELPGVSRKKTGLKLSCHCRELCLCPLFECGKRHTWEKTMRKVRPEFSKLGGTCYDPSEQRRKLIEANERYRQRLKLALQAKLESTKGILGYIDGIAKVRDRYPQGDGRAGGQRGTAEG